MCPGVIYVSSPLRAAYDDLGFRLLAFAHIQLSILGLFVLRGVFNDGRQQNRTSSQM